MQIKRTRPYQSTLVPLSIIAYHVHSISITRRMTSCFINGDLQEQNDYMSILNIFSKSQTFPLQSDYAEPT